MDSDDLPVLDEVIIPAGFAVLERLLHLLLLPLFLLRIPHEHVDCANTETGLAGGEGAGRRGRRRRGRSRGILVYIWAYCIKCLVRPIG